MAHQSYSLEEETLENLMYSTCACPPSFWALLPYFTVFLPDGSKFSASLQYLIGDSTDLLINLIWTLKDHIVTWKNISIRTFCGWMDAYRNSTQNLVLIIYSFYDCRNFTRAVVWNKHLLGMIVRLPECGYDPSHSWIHDDTATSFNATKCHLSFMRLLLRNSE